MKSLRPSLLSCLLIAPALIAGMSPDRAFGSHALAQPIVGQITASPTSTEIEVNHHPYHIKAHSPAEKTSPTLNVGQKVSLILDGPSGDAKSNVIGISNAPST
ncbi:MAG: hypothetical protein ABSD02_04355 [Steroidobacteraceae bacterium]|jgi:hypothetical protein